MDTIQFYHNPMSRGRIVHWMLEEIGAPYEINLLNLEKREHKTPHYLSVNPMGKIPAIVHRDTVITESAAICAYLADAFPQAGLAPAIQSTERGTYYRWLFFAAGCVEPALTEKMFNRTPVDRPGQLGYGSYEDTMKTLESALKPGPFILGDHFTAADVYIASQIGWGIMRKAIEPIPAFHRYLERCRERAAFKRFMAGAASL